MGSLAAATWIWASNRKMGLLKAALAEWRREERARAPKVMWKPAIRMQSESYVEIRGATTHSVSLSIIKRNGERRNNLREKVRSCKVYWRQVEERGDRSQTSLSSDLIRYHLLQQPSNRSSRGEVICLSDRKRRFRQQGKQQRQTSSFPFGVPDFISVIMSIFGA